MTSVMQEGDVKSDYDYLRSGPRVSQLCNTP